LSFLFRSKIVGGGFVALVQRTAPDVVYVIFILVILMK
jgi:hypothetical protein